MLHDEHGFPVMEEPDFRDDLMAREESELGRIDEKIMERIRGTIEEEMRTILWRILAEVETQFHLDCLRLATGFPMARGVSGETIAKRHGKSREAVRKCKERLRRDLGLPQGIYDKNEVVKTKHKGRL
jgi:hypothetical protein